MSSNIAMRLEEAIQIAHRFLNAAGDLVDMAVIAGSIRRVRPIVHDVDIVVRALSDQEIKRRIYGMMETNLTVLRWGPKLAAITYRGVPIDLYFSTPETFHTLLLIRTGSKENNIRLATIAKRKRWKLHASGEGLFNERGERIAGDSERSIYDALGVPYQEPWERG